MTGSWLIVKWVVHAICWLCVTLGLVVGFRRWPNHDRKDQRVFSLTLLAVMLPNLVRDFSHSVSVLRVSYIVEGSLAAGLVVASLIRLFGGRGLLKADS